MGNPLFGVDIAGIVADVIGPAVLDVTITRYVRGARDPNNLTAGVALTPVTFACKGFWEDYSGLAPPGVTVEENDRKAVLIGDTIPDGGIPQRNDEITIEGATLFVAKLQSRDPAAAVYVFQCGDRRGSDGV